MKKIEYEKIWDEILECDKNIRYVGVYDYDELYERFKLEKRVHYPEKKRNYHYLRQFTDGLSVKKISEKIGKPIFALAKYEKIYRVIISIRGAGLILISAELNADINGIMYNILKIKNKYSW